MSKRHTYTSPDLFETPVHYQQNIDCCPVCGSSDIEGEHVEVYGLDAAQKVHCNECSASWQDIFCFQQTVDCEYDASYEDVPADAYDETMLSDHVLFKYITPGPDAELSKFDKASRKDRLCVQLMHTMQSITDGPNSYLFFKKAHDMIRAYAKSGTDLKPIRLLSVWGWLQAEFIKDGASVYLVIVNAVTSTTLASMRLIENSSFIDSLFDLYDRMKNPSCNYLQNIFFEAYTVLNDTQARAIIADASDND